MEISGRVIECRILGKKLAFAQLYNPPSQIRLVFRFGCDLKKGDLVTLDGSWNKDVDTPEFEVTNYTLVSRPKFPIHDIPEHLSKALQPKQLGKLLLRSKVESCLHNFFKENNFNLITSPSIVGDWVKGQTGSFPIDFYGSKAYLSISNMLFHHVYAANGLTRFYEISKLFRQEKPSSKKRLAEFTILDISMADQKLKQFMQFCEKILEEIWNEFQQFQNSDKIQKLVIDTITYSKILEDLGKKSLSGHQFNSKVKKYLNQKFEGFVWVVNFPESSRPFYVKCIDGYGLDCQLWYRGENYVAAGGERETDRAVVERKIINEGKEPDKYKMYLDSLDFGIRSLCSLGIGIERILSVLIKDSVNSEFTHFPIYRGVL